MKNNVFYVVTAVYNNITTREIKCNFNGSTTSHSKYHMERFSEQFCA